MLIVGLTGGIASGKSTVSSLFRSSSTIPLIDLDILSRLAVAPNTYALSALVHHFGPSVLLPNGELNREILGEIVFGNERQRKVLNGIVHPAVRRLLVWELLKCWARGEKVVLVDAPLLVEAGLWKFCGAIIVVYCSQTLQLQRLRHRNSLSLPAAQARLSAQLPLSSKLPYADYVIDNSGPLPDLTIQVQRTLSKIQARVGWSWFISWLCPPFGLAKGVVCIVWRRYGKGVGRNKKSGGGTRGEKDLELRERDSRGGEKIFGRL